MLDLLEEVAFAWRNLHHLTERKRLLLTLWCGLLTFPIRLMWCVSYSTSYIPALDRSACLSPSCEMTIVEAVVSGLICAGPKSDHAESIVQGGGQARPAGGP